MILTAVLAQYSMDISYINTNLPTTKAWTMSTAMTFVWRILEASKLESFIACVGHHLNSNVVSSRETLFSMPLACSPHIWCFSCFTFSNQWFIIIDYIYTTMDSRIHRGRFIQIIKRIGKNIASLISWLILMFGWWWYSWCSCEIFFFSSHRIY